MRLTHGAGIGTDKKRIDLPTDCCFGIGEPLAQHSVCLEGHAAD